MSDQRNSLVKRFGRLVWSEIPIALVALASVSTGGAWKYISGSVGVLLDSIATFLIVRGGALFFQIVVLMLIVVVGTALYWLRCMQQNFYGWLEIFVGATTAMVVANTYSEPQTPFGQFLQR